MAGIAPLAPAQQTDSSLLGHSAAIPFDKIGSVAGKQYNGDGLAVVSDPDGAAAVVRVSAFKCPRQDGAKGQPFRVVASSLGHAEMETFPAISRKKITKNTHASRGPEAKWEIPV